MAANCFSPIRGKRVRATLVDSCGTAPAANTAASQVTSSGFITVQYEFDYQAGTELVQLNADGQMCINDRTCDQFKRIPVTIDFCNVDPDMLSAITGMPVEVDGAGVTQGIRIQEGLACNQFGLELWTGTTGAAACPLTNQVDTLTEGGSGLTSFTLTISAVGMTTVTTASIPAASTAAAVQTIIQNAINAAGIGDVAVTGATSGPYTVTFTGELAGKAVTVTATPTGGSGTLTVAVVTAGGTVAVNGVFGYVLTPFLKNGTLQSFTFGNAVTTFQVKAWTSAGSNWGAGPYNVIAQGSAGVPSALKTPIGAFQHALLRATTVPPPAAACGLQAMPAAPTAAA